MNERKKERKKSPTETRKDRRQTTGSSYESPLPVSTLLPLPTAPNDLRALHKTVHYGWPDTRDTPNCPSCPSPSHSRAARSEVRRQAMVDEWYGPWFITLVRQRGPFHRYTPPPPTPPLTHPLLRLPPYPISCPPTPSIYLLAPLRTLTLITLTLKATRRRSLRSTSLQD